jgi:hypothetical protein
MHAIVLYASSDTLELPHDSANLRNSEAIQPEKTAAIAPRQSTEKGQCQRKQI